MNKCKPCDLVYFKYDDKITKGIVVRIIGEHDLVIEIPGYLFKQKVREADYNVYTYDELKEIKSHYDEAKMLVDGKCWFDNKKLMKKL